MPGLEPGVLRIDRRAWAGTMCTVMIALTSSTMQGLFNNVEMTVSSQPLQEQAVWEHGHTGIAILRLEMQGI